MHCGIYVVCVCVYVVCVFLCMNVWLVCGVCVSGQCVHCELGVCVRVIYVEHQQNPPLPVVRGILRGSLDAKGITWTSKGGQPDAGPVVGGFTAGRLGSKGRESQLGGSGWPWV